MTEADSPNPIALVDLDNTLADYKYAMLAALDKLRGPNEPAAEFPSDLNAVPDYIKARMHLIKSQPGFWLNLHTIEQGFRVLQMLRGMKFDVRVLTAGPAGVAQGWAEKSEWCWKFVGYDTPITITRDKSTVYGRLLFDDYPPYFEAWLARRPRGHVLCLPYSYNEEYTQGGPKEHERILRLDDAGKRRLRPFLEHVRSLP